jgi:hypothetical protein
MTLTMDLTQKNQNSHKKKPEKRGGQNKQGRGRGKKDRMNTKET